MLGIRKGDVLLTILLSTVAAVPMCAVGQDQGFATIVQGTWGNGQDEFGRSNGAIPDYDIYPENIILGPSDVLVIRDRVNSRIKIYDGNGAFVGIVEPIGIASEERAGWPQGDVLVGQDRIFAKTAQLLQAYDFNGALVGSLEGVAGELTKIVSGQVVVKDGEVWARYSADVEFISSSLEKPVAFDDGQINVVSRIDHTSEEPAFDLEFQGNSANLSVSNVSGEFSSVTLLSDGMFAVLSIVSDPDRAFIIEYDADFKSEIIPQGFRVTLFNPAGEVISSLNMPTSVYPATVAVARGNWVDAQPTATFADPVISKSGRIFQQRRYDDRFEIVVWEIG